ncbi:MAG: hypothetical protein COA62_15940 [Rhodobiaceae bacterium]|nr:MAG: hypothetical protein COA62_15940 [Rhodobiaceae bacterium]
MTKRDTKSIASFKCKKTEQIFNRNSVPKFQAIEKAALRKLDQISVSKDLNDLRTPPGNKLHPLSGDRKGQHAIKINDQWRVCFTWEDDQAHGVEIIDYH